MVNWSDLGVFISVCGSVVVSLCFAIQKSRCSKVTICGGLVKCDRKIPMDKKDIENGEDNLSNLNDAPINKL